jgi:hypothetical protein
MNRSERSAANCPTGFSSARDETGTTVVRARIETDVDTLPEAFAQAVDQYIEQMTAARWSRKPVGRGIRVTHLIPT